MSKTRGIERRDRRSPHVVRWRDEQGQHSKSFKIYTDAVAFQAKIRADKRAGSYTSPALGKITVGNYAEVWMAGRVLAETTRAAVTSRFQTNVMPRFGDTRLMDVDTADIKIWVAELRTRLKRSSVQSVAGDFAHLLNSAVQDRRLARNPMPRPLPLGPNDRSEVKFLTYTQAMDLVDAVPPLYRGLIHTAVATGMRWGELAGLRTNRLDLDTARVPTATVYDTLAEVAGQKTLREYTTKTLHSRRILLLEAHLADRLRAHLAEFGPGEQNSVFHGPRGALLSRTTFLARVLAPAATAAGVPGVTMQDLRHSCASILIARGASVLQVQRWLGHAKASMTLDTYSHLFPSDAASTVAFMQAEADAHEESRRA